MVKPIIPFSRVKTGVGATLIKISHPDLDTPMYLCDNNDKIVYKGIEYLPYFFEFERPEQTDDTDGSATLTISSVDRQIINIIRSAPATIRPQVEIVAVWVDTDENGDPIFSEIEGYVFEIAGAQMNARSAICTLGLDTLILYDFPHDVFSSANCFGAVQ